MLLIHLRFTAWESPFTLYLLLVLAMCFQSSSSVSVIPTLDRIVAQQYGAIVTLVSRTRVGGGGFAKNLCAHTHYDLSLIHISRVHIVSKRAVFIRQHCSTQPQSLVSDSKQRNELIVNTICFLLSNTRTLTTDARAHKQSQIRLVYSFTWLQVSQFFPCSGYHVE